MTRTGVVVRRADGRREYPVPERSARDPLDDAALRLHGIALHHAPPRVGEVVESRVENQVVFGVADLPDRAPEPPLVRGAVRLLEVPLVVEAPLAEGDGRVELEIVLHISVVVTGEAGIVLDTHEAGRGEIGQASSGAGQMCCGASRFVVHDPVAQRGFNRP